MTNTKQALLNLPVCFLLEAEAHPTNTAHDSEIDLSEESASDSDAELDVVGFLHV
jgi:hypothetical protein